MGTTFIEENEALSLPRTEHAHLSENSPRNVTFPHTVRFRTLTATIYGRSAGYQFYRMAVRVAGKRVVRSFQTFTQAKAEAEKKLRELAKGNQSAGLSAKESADALAIREAVQAFYRDTGRKVSPLQAVNGYIDALRVLPLDVSPEEAVRTFRQSVATVERKPLALAVSEFCVARKQKTVSKDGKRSALNPVYVADTARMLTEFSATFTGLDVCDLTKQHLDLFISSRAKLSPKSRNHFRATLRMFLGWCTRRDFIAANHRLLESEGLRKEDADTGDVEFYSPQELRAMLDNTTKEMRVIIALQSFGGLRLQEALRLDWRDVFTIPGHVEISSAKSKTRSRRLVDINATLESWLSEFRDSEGPVTVMTLDAYTWQLIQLRKRLKIPSKKNGLRHGFLSAHYAIHQNEGMTAAQAGTSPQMLFKHYRGLTTQAAAQNWFAVMPADMAKNVIKLTTAAGG